MKIICFFFFVDLFKYHIINWCNIVTSFKQSIPYKKSWKKKSKTHGFIVLERPCCLDRPLSSPPSHHHKKINWRLAKGRQGVKRKTLEKKIIQFTLFRHREVLPSWKSGAAHWRGKQKEIRLKSRFYDRMFPGRLLPGGWKWRDRWKSHKINWSWMNLWSLAWARFFEHVDVQLVIMMINTFWWQIWNLKYL